MLDTPSSGRGVPEGSRLNHGVGFAVKSKLLQRIPESPIGINERLMTWRIPLAKKRFATLISAYAPTLDAEHNIKEDFYRALDAILQKTLATDRLILKRDFNARVGTEHLVWSKVIGQHGVWNVFTMFYVIVLIEGINIIYSSDIPL